MNKKQLKTDTVLQGVIFSSLGLFIMLNLSLCVTADMIDKHYARGTGLINTVCLLTGILFISLLSVVVYVFYAKKEAKTDGKNRSSLLFNIISSVALLLFLICSTHFYYFKTGWDAGTVVQNAIYLADGNTGELYNEYYSVYPNNVALTFFLSLIIRIGRILPLGTDYYILIAFQCVCMVICSVLVYYTVLALSLPKEVAWLARAFFILLVCLSPWVIVPYSDTIGMFLVILALYLYASEKLPFALGFVILFGTMIKPTVIIFAIAAVIIDIVGLFNEEQRKKIIKRLLFAFAGGVTAYILCKVFTSLAGFELDSQKAMSPAHYLMMGLNEQQRGVINLTDQEFSFGIADYNERVRADLSVALERFVELWPFRLIHHFLRKMLYVMGDGTFAWAVEGGFITEPIWTGHEKIEAVFREFFYPDGKRYLIFKRFMQSLWLGFNFFSIAALFGRKEDKKVACASLAFIGMILFELLFEPRARHLLLAAPVMCILAAIGSVRILRKIHVYFRKDKKI